MNAPEFLKKNPFPWLGSLAAVVLLGGAFFRHSSLPDSEAELEQLTGEVRRIQGNLIHAASLEEQIATLKSLNEEVLTRVARASDLAGNSQYFYKLQGETGVKEISLDRGPVRELGPKGTKGSFVGVTFSSTVQGRYSQIMAFIQKVEGAAWFGRIRTLNIRQAQAERSGAEPQIVLALTVELLALP